MQDNWRLLETLGLKVIPKFLDEETCERWLKEAREEEGHVATVGLVPRLDLDRRRTKVVRVSPEVKAELHSKLEALQPLLAEQFGHELERFEAPQVLRYQEGDFFKPHRDNSHDGDDCIAKRRTTAVIFLNAPGEESYEGGLLVLYGLFDNPLLERTGLPVKVEPGLLVAFPPELIHEVTPVEQGERYTITVWYH